MKKDSSFMCRQIGFEELFKKVCQRVPEADAEAVREYLEVHVQTPCVLSDAYRISRQIEAELIKQGEI